MPRTASSAIRRNLALTLAAACLFAAGLLASTMHAQVKLQGAPNFRDIGGYRTTDGKVTKSGVLFRSSQLSTLTAADYERMGPLDIRYVYDLRTDAERSAQPTHWTAGAEPKFELIAVGIPAKGDPSQDLRKVLSSNPDGAQVQAAMQKLTAQLVIDGAPAIGTVLHDMASGETPAIVHCTAGKDRTGVTVAILLKLLNVPTETIYADYLRSNAATPAMLAALKQAAANRPAGQATSQQLPPMKPEALQALYGVDASYLDAAFKAIDEHYGSFDNYVSHGLKLTTFDRQALRTHFLQPAA